MSNQATVGPRPVTFGLRLPNSGPLATPEAVFKAADAAEALGYDVVWVHDHISWVHERLTHFATGSIEACKGQDPNFFESLCTLAVLAGRTRRVRLGVAVLVLPLRDPRVLARQVLTIDALSAGRLILGMSVGNIPNDFEVMQLDWKRRGRITNDYLAALDAALSDVPLAEYHGEFVDFKGAGFFPKPRGLQRWISARSTAGLRRAARWADGWFVGSQTPENYAAMRQTLFRFLPEFGRTKDSITCGVELFAAVEDSAEKAIRVSALSLEGWGGAGIKLSCSIIGGPQEAIEKIKTYIQAGAHHFELRLIAHDMDHYLATARRIAERVIPRL